MTRHRRHKPFYIAALAAAVTFGFAKALSTAPAEMLTANVFFLAYLSFAIHALATLDPADASASAGDSDLPVVLIFLVTLCAAAASLGAFFSIINTDLTPSGLNRVVTLTAVPLGWLTVHVMATLHYAHTYWSNRSAGGNGGLSFPETDQPSGSDFAYFALTIGMTAQTSDVVTTRSRMRRLVMVHGVVSFIFNTIILAAVVNAAVNMGS